MTRSGWRIGGTNIGDYKEVKPELAPSQSTVSSALVDPTQLANRDLTTYWLYPSTPKTPFKVTYYYCVFEPLAAGEACSDTARAAFNVNGPKATVAPVLTTPDATNAWGVTPSTDQCPAQYLKFGVATATTPCPGQTVLAGIAFLGDVTDAGGGKFNWLQTQISFNATGIPVGFVEPLNEGPGLDNKDPYLGVNRSGLETFDAPAVGLANAFTTESLSASFNMHLMWRAKIDPSYIRVPVGYVNWSITGYAGKSGGKPPWIVDCGNKVAPCPGASATPWASEDTNGPAPDMPTWLTVIRNTAGAPIEPAN